MWWGRGGHRAGIAGDGDLHAVRRSMEAECAEMEPHLAHLGKEDFDLHQSMRKWQIDLGNIVGF